MATVFEAVVSVLEDDSGVGTLAANRIYPAILPESPTLPAITLSLISNERVSNLSGPSLLAHSRIQINAWAETLLASIGLETAIRQALDGLTTTAAGVEIPGTLLEDSGDLFEPAVGVEVAQRRFGRRMDFMVWNREA